MALPSSPSPSPSPSRSIYAGEDDLESGVAHTARWTAAMRCIEHRRADAILRDPLAEAFAGEEACEKWDKETTLACIDQPKSHSHIAIRARALDDILQDELERLNSDAVQVVNLGAGFCTRAWRLQAPGTYINWFELDRPDSMHLKAEIAKMQVRPSVANYQTIGIDFSKPDASVVDTLEQHDFDTCIPTIFIMEGMLMYLTVADVQELALEINSSVEADIDLCIVMTTINEGFYRQLRDPDPAMLKEFPGTGEVFPLFQSSWEGGVKSAFEEAGFVLESVISREDYGRNVLGVEMTDFNFPDKRTSTELIIVMRRPNECKNSQMCDLCPIS